MRNARSGNRGHLRARRGRPASSRSREGCKMPGRRTHRHLRARRSHPASSRREGCRKPGRELVVTFVPAARRRGRTSRKLRPRTRRQFVPAAGRRGCASRKPSPRTRRRLRARRGRHLVRSRGARRRRAPRRQRRHRGLSCDGGLVGVRHCAQLAFIASIEARSCRRSRYPSSMRRAAGLATVVFCIITALGALIVPGTAAADAPPDGGVPAPRPCCRHCNAGKPCGDTCIPRSHVCRHPPGCAC